MPSSLILTLLLTLGGPVAQADVMHFMSGKRVEGKLYRVTGDLIEFREQSTFGSQMSTHRIQLTNRHDIIETKKKRYFGEIVYVDKFKVDLQTATGIVKLNRLKVKNIVVGSPAEQPVSNLDVMPLAPSNAPAVRAIRPQNQPVPMPEDSQTTKALPFSDPRGEDQDAIPAVNH